MKEIRRRKKNIRGTTIAIVILLLILGAGVVFGLFRVRKLVVTGNRYYSATRIQKEIMNDGLCKNSLYLIWKFQDAKKVENALPFLKDAKAEMISPMEVKVTVTEKDEIGYLLNQGTYVYFDSDGIVVEESSEVNEGVPLITGLDVEKATLYEKLPVKDDSLYATIVSLTKILNNNGIVPEEIRFGTRSSLTLIFGDIKVNLGEDVDMEDKIAALDSILPQLEGRSGILYMESYAANGGRVTFRSDGGSSEEVSDGSSADGTDGSDSGDGTTADGSGGASYSESDGNFSTDAEGNKTYTDAAGNVTSQADGYNYTDENGQIISDGYGYIDPYTGAYIVNGQ